MRNPKLKTNYNYVREDVLSATGHSVVQQTTDSEYIATGVTLAGPLKTAVEALDAAMAETATPSRAQTAQREKLRRAVRGAMGTLGAQLNLAYPGQAPALLSSGLELADASGVPRPVDTPPTDVALTDSTVSGYVDLGFKRPPGATITMSRYTTDPTLAEDHWCVKVGGGRKQILGPYAKGTELFAKVAGINASTTEPDYSVVVSRIVQ